MAFNPDPFEQAKKEVADKSMADQIAHSGIFHSVRSAFSSKGSFASKGAGVALGVGKLFLALIPVPVVGAVVGATADAINGKVRSKLHERHLKPGVSHEEFVKYTIKELTVENLDRYRWKVAHSIEELNKGIAAYNASNQTCDDMYAFCLLSEQVDRRKKRLVDELGKFQEVLNRVNDWIAELDRTQLSQLEAVKNAVKQKSRDEIQAIGQLVATNPQHAAQIARYTAEHAGCEKWCFMKRTAKYDPNTNWEVLKRNAGGVVAFLQPIAISAIAVRQSDYTSDADNSKFRN